MIAARLATRKGTGSEFYINCYGSVDRNPINKSSFHRRGMVAAQWLEYLPEN